MASAKIPMEPTLLVLFGLDGAALTVPMIGLLYIVNTHARLPVQLLPSYYALSFLPYSLKPLFAVVTNRLLELQIAHSSKASSTVSNTSSDNSIQIDWTTPESGCYGLLSWILLANAVCTALTCTIPFAAETTGSLAIESIALCYLWGFLRGCFNSWAEYIYQLILLQGAKKATLHHQSRHDSNHDSNHDSTHESNHDSNRNYSHQNLAEIASVYQSQAATARSIACVVSYIVVFGCTFMTGKNKSDASCTYNTAVALLLSSSALQLVACAIARRNSFHEYHCTHWYCCRSFICRQNRCVASHRSCFCPSLLPLVQSSPLLPTPNSSDGQESETDPLLSPDTLHPQRDLSQHSQHPQYRQAFDDNGNLSDSTTVSIVTGVQLSVVLLIVRQPLWMLMAVPSSSSAVDPTLRKSLFARETVHWAWWGFFMIAIVHTTYALSQALQRYKHTHNDDFTPSTTSVAGTDRTTNVDSALQYLRQRKRRLYGVGIFLFLQNAMPDASYLLTSYMYAAFQEQRSSLQLMPLISLFDSIVLTFACWTYGKAISAVITHSRWMNHDESIDPTTTVGSESVASRSMQLSTGIHAIEENGGISNIARGDILPYRQLQYIIVGTTLIASLASLLNLFSVHLLSTSLSATTIVCVILINAVVAFTSEWKFMPSLALATMASLDDDGSCDRGNSDSGENDTQHAHLKSLNVGTKFSCMITCIDLGDQVGAILVGILVTLYGTSRDNHWQNLDSMIITCSVLMVLPLLQLLLLVHSTVFK